MYREDFIEDPDEKEKVLALTKNGKFRVVYAEKEKEKLLLEDWEQGRGR